MNSPHPVLHMLIIFAVGGFFGWHLDNIQRHFGWKTGMKSANYWLLILVFGLIAGPLVGSILRHFGI